MKRHNEDKRKKKEDKYLLKELAFRGHNKSSFSLNKDNYRELPKSYGNLCFVFVLNARSDVRNGCCTVCVFTDVSRDVQNYLIA